MYSKLIPQIEQMLVTAKKNGDAKDIERIIRSMYNIVSHDALQKEVYHYGIHEYNAAMNSKKTAFIKTGYKSIDDVAMMRTGYVTTTPAYKNHGKSAFLTNLLLNMVNIYSKQNFHYMFYSFEMKEHNVLRQLARMAWYDMFEKNTGAMMERDVWNFNSRREGSPENKFEQEFVKQMTGVCHFFSDRLSPEKLAIHVNKNIMDHNVKVIFIDYVQDMEIKESSYNYSTDIAKTMVKLSEIASENSVCVITAAQFGRTKNSTADGKPDKRSICYLENIFGSSEIESKSDVVYGIYNRDVHSAQVLDDYSWKTTQTIEIDVLKSREQKMQKGILLGLNTVTGRIEQ